MLNTPLILLAVILVATCTAKPRAVTDEAELKVINVESVAKEDVTGEAESPLLSRLRRSPTKYGGGKKSGGGGGCNSCGGGGGQSGSYSRSSSSSSSGSYGRSGR